MTQKATRSSLHDIARHLGLSAMTVSRVINNSGPVSASTRQRVEDALGALGFKKDRFASINARKRKPQERHFSVVVDAMVEEESDIDSFDFYARVALGAIRRLEAAGCHIVMTDLTRRPDERSQAVAEADAIIFCSPVPADVLRRVQRLNASIVRVSAFHAQGGASLVRPDDAGGGAMVADLAARGGHHQVAVLTSPHASHVERADAFTARMRALNPTAHTDVITFPLLADGIHSDECALERILTDYWSQQPQPSLFFAVGGFATLILYRFLRDQRIDVPSQIGLIGFDALPFYDHLDVPITRMEFSVGPIGTRAAEETLRRLSAPEGDEPTTILLPCRFVEGRSFLDAAAMVQTNRARYAL
jgi:DNA-binding LacI/PurR family transcriptional regulator